MTSSKIKLLVCYHKKDKLFKNNFIVPIHCGRSIKKISHKDGCNSEEDLKWLCENLIGDDTGENISHLNRHFNEMTGIYWAWKNYEKIGNPDFVGFMHYRLLFSLSDFYLSQSKATLLGRLCLTEENLLNFLSQYNLVYKRKLPLSRKHYSHISFSPFNRYLNLSSDNHPELYKKLKIFEADFEFMGNNMFIMSKKDFFHYCETIFPLLFELYEKSKEDMRQRKISPRFVGYASEFLTGFYIDWLKEQPHIKGIGIKTFFIYDKFKYFYELGKTLFKVYFFNQKNLFPYFWFLIFKLRR